MSMRLGLFYASLANVLDLPAQSMLCFNNTSTIHQFRNHQRTDGSTPEALSIRMKHCCSPEPRVWRHMTLPWLALRPWWRRPTEGAGGAQTGAASRATGRRAAGT